MLGRLKAMLGIGAPAAPAPRGPAGPLDPDAGPKAIAAALSADPGLVPLAAQKLDADALLGVLDALKGQGGLRVDLVRARTLGAHYVSAEGLARLGAALSPAERGLVVAGARGSRLQALQQAGFDAPTGGRVKVDARDLRAVAERGSLPETLAEWGQANAFDARLGAVRAGGAGFAADERTQLRRALDQLSAGDREAVRRALVLTPPHPRLKELRGDAALKGPATVDGLLHLMSGAPFGAHPPASLELRQNAERAVEMAARSLPPEQRAAWADQLARSDGLVDLVLNTGTAGLVMIDRLGPDLAEVVNVEWASRGIVRDLAQQHPERLGELAAHAKARGASASLEGLRALDKASFGARFRPAELIGAVGFERAVDVAGVLGADEHGAKAYAHLHGGAGLDALLRTKRGDALRGALADAGKTIVEFGSGQTPIYGGAARPPMQTPRTARVALAEEAIAKAAGVDVAALRSGALDLRQRGAVSRAMRGFVADRDPELAKQLDTELLGRRFVARRYYDGLYAAGARNPEHRYSAATFESWAQGAEHVRGAAEASRGRALEPGEFTRVMQEAHVAAARGMVEIHESHLKGDDLGRLRSRPEDHVQLGGMTHAMDAHTASLLARNPYLSPDQMVLDEKDGVVTRSVIFARGPDVPGMVAELDAWVRANESRLPPEQLAAEVHHRLVSIHPFMDGNGRTSKLMADFVLQRAGIEPPVWRQGDVMKNVERWPEAVREGVDFAHGTVERYFRVAADPKIGLRPPAPELRP